MGTDPTPVDVVVVGAGQSGLAVGYHLRRVGLVPGRDVVLVDAAVQPGGAWPRTWDSLRLFSPAGYSSLPGRLMPPWVGDEPSEQGEPGFPPRDHVVAYLADYERRYDLRVRRPQRVEAVTRLDDDPAGRLLVTGPGLRLAARVVVSATGTWEQPFRPAVPGAADFGGRQLHAADYRGPDGLRGLRVVVVGGGNSAAQILAEISLVAEATWTTLRPPRFLPDEIDGRALFDAATARVRAVASGQEHAGVGGLGDIVVVPPVRAARERGALEARAMFDQMTPTGVAWRDGRTLDCDVVVWCTGFRPVLRHLAGLHLRDRTGRVPVGGASGTRSLVEPRVHLVGYGDWVGPASATLIGVGRTARATADDVGRRLAARA